MIISNVKKYRIEKKLGISQLAELCGVNRKTISRAENNDPFITLQNAMNISQVLHISIDKLFINKKIGINDMIEMLISR